MGALLVSPATGETTASYLSRIAGRYGMDPSALLAWWQWTGSRPRDASGGFRDDAEVLLNISGQQLLAQLTGIEPQDLVRALPAFVDGPQAMDGPTEGAARGRWQVASSGAHGPVAYGCRLCTAARTGHDTVVVRYAAPWQRVCARHHRWMLTAGDGHRHRNLDLRAAPEIAASHRAWPEVVRQAADGGADPGRVFALARAVVCAWWEQALEWEQERIWPARLHALAGGDAGPRFWWWWVIARDAVTFPETVALGRGPAVSTGGQCCGAGPGGQGRVVRAGAGGRWRSFGWPRRSPRRSAGGGPGVQRAARLDPHAHRGPPTP